MPEREPLFVGTLTDATTNFFGTGYTNVIWTPQRAVDDDKPILHGMGPVEFSTCQEVLPFPVICHDVNGYYRTLGVHWKATKKELMRAYQAFGPHPSAWQTHCFKQLRDDSVRKVYDATPLGSLYIDQYVIEELNRKITMHAAKRRAAGLGDLSTEETLSALGMKTFNQVNNDTPDEMVDGEDEVDEDDPSLNHEPPVWPWSFYLWKTRKIDEGLLREWQETLVRAFSARGVSIRLAVGLHGASAHPWVTAAVGYRTVVFLHHDHQPTVEAAEAVVDRVVQDRADDRKALTS